jgi:hypothetical protein
MSAIKSSKASKAQLVAQATTTGKFAGVEGKCAVCGKPANHPLGSTCTAHLGKVGKYYKPAPTNPAGNPAYVPLSTLCATAQANGKSAGFVVRLTGGDAGTQPPAAPVWQVYTWQHGNRARKYLAVDAVAALAALLPKK